jgi:hypothetical protein
MAPTGIVLKEHMESQSETAVERGNHQRLYYSVTTCSSGRPLQLNTTILELIIVEFIF